MTSYPALTTTITSLVDKQTPSEPSLLVDYNSFSADPALVTGQLTRQQWTDYKNRFIPIENQLMQMTSYMNPELTTQEISRATAADGYVNRALDVSESNARLNYARYGMTPNTAQQTAMDRQNSLTRSAATVDAANRIRQRIADRNQLIATGAIPNAGRAYGLPATQEG